MPQPGRSLLAAIVIPVALAAGLFIAGCDRVPTTPTIIAAAAEAAETRLTITYPSEGTLFPPESVARIFLWEDKTDTVDRWSVVVRDDAGHELVRDAAGAPRWIPSEEIWKQIKRASVERDAEVIVTGADDTQPATASSSARVDIRTSKDAVGDSLFYRVPLLSVQDKNRNPMIKRSLS